MRHLGCRLQSIVQQVEEEAAKVTLIDGKGLRQQGTDTERNAQLLRLRGNALQDGIDCRVRRVDLGGKLLQLSVQMA